MKLDDLIVYSDCSLMDALRKIDLNRQGFVLVTERDYTMLATLTDGDIRRCMIKGLPLETPVTEGCNDRFKYLTKADHFYEAIDVFKNEKIQFIPILDEQNHLINVLSKRVMHALLLQDIYPTLEYPFLDVDASIIDFEIYQRPWGFYKTTILNDMFQSKIISVKPGASLSLQLHKYREEHWIVIHGKGQVCLDESVIDVHDGSYVFIPKGCRHRLINTDSEGSLVLIEVQCGQYFGEDDIVRFADDYGRI